jgi:hypothetical protein
VNRHANIHAFPGLKIETRGTSVNLLVSIAEEI